MYINYQNRPPHLYRDNTIYFITANTVNKNHYFNDNPKKNTLINTLKEALDKFHFGLYAWVILDNHYHLLLKITESKTLPLFIRFLHSKSTILLNKLDKWPGRKVWHNYWDRCIRSENDFWTRFNYIHHNPVKHGYANSMKEYKFSSYSSYLKKYGNDWLVSCFERFPVKDFSLEEE